MFEYLSYIRFTKFLLVFVFIVIIAGSIVRTTQSGMGCPDWPTCFGNTIPPTEEYQVHFQQNHHYKKGQFIIYNDSLKYAKESFNSTQTYNPANWEQYEKHNYAKFNVYQTWIEYANRLCTGVLGILILIHIVWSYRLFFKTRRNIFWLSASLLLLTAFEAWLGKVVVDTNLAVVKVTLHMLFALLIAAVAVIIIHKLEKAEKVKNTTLSVLSVAALVMVLVQIILGTDVREQIDEISLSYNYEQRDKWLNHLDQFFDIHKFFAWFVTAVCLYLFWQSLRFKTLQKNAAYILVSLLATMFLGLTLMYLQMPAAAQPLHLLFACILIISLFSLRLKLK